MASSSSVPSVNEEVIDRFLANVDVWQTIFEVLSVKDRIRLEMTNKRLHMLMFDYWKRVTSFDSKKCLTAMSHNSSINKNRWADIVSICVNRIGDGLRSLTISEKFLPMGCLTDNLRSIGEGCPNVETMNFAFEDKYATLDIRFDSFSRLKTLIVSSAEASASVFLSIPTSIEVIRGLGGTVEEQFDNAAQMEGFFANRPSLRDVDIGGLRIRDGRKADIFHVIAERCSHLKSIKLEYNHNNWIDYSGVIALESMKELRLPHVDFDEMEIVTICERSPLVESLELNLRLSSNIDLKSVALNALGSLTMLGHLRLYRVCSHWYIHAIAPSLVTEFVRDLARNSGPSLRNLDLPSDMPLPRAAIEALANGCPKLRDVRFFVRVGEAEPASIRFLIDCIVAHPSWITQTGERTLLISIYVFCEGGDDAEAGRAPFKALADPVANLPFGVQLIIL